jgi:replicative DNA helicase
MLCIDQYSLMRDSSNSRQYYEKFAKISTDLKNLQVQLQIPILMATQLNREKNENGPDSTSIAGSDKVGQDATSIYFLERTQTGIKLTIGKHRDAKVGAVLNYTWDIDKGNFIYVPVEGDATNEEVAKTEKSRREYYTDKSDSVF